MNKIYYIDDPSYRPLLIFLAQSLNSSLDLGDRDIFMKTFSSENVSYKN